MSKYLLANWKSNKTMAEAEVWLGKFCRRPHDPELQVIVAPPAPFLVPMWHILQKLKVTNVALAVQDLSPFPLGSYTGEVAARMVRDFAEYVILGHSERRRYFHETSQEIANKVSEAAAVGIRPIVCVDLPYAREQLAAINEEDSAELIIGYGPVEAIGIDVPQSPARVSDAIDELQAIAPGKPVLYGGSVNKDNVGSYLELAGISGLMVGSASLDPEEFAAIGAKMSLTGQ